MRYERPEDIDIVPKSFEYLFMPEEMKETIKANFRDIAFCIFTFCDNGHRKIGDYKVKFEDQPNFMNENIILFYMEKPIFKLIGCNDGAWVAETYCAPDTVEMFCYLVNQKFNVFDSIDDDYSSIDYGDLSVFDS